MPGQPSLPLVDQAAQDAPKFAPRTEHLTGAKLEAAASPTGRGGSTPGPPFRVSRALTGRAQTPRANLTPVPYPNPHGFSFSRSPLVFGRRMPVHRAEGAREMATIVDADLKHNLLHTQERSFQQLLRLLHP